MDSAFAGKDKFLRRINGILSDVKEKARRAYGLMKLLSYRER